MLAVAELARCPAASWDPRRDDAEFEFAFDFILDGVARLQSG
jgi:hypothetical protein